MPIPLSKFATMDPFILASAVNMQLRDEFSSLDDLCKSHEISRDELVKKLKKHGLRYDEQLKQLK